MKHLIVVFVTLTILTLACTSTLPGETPEVKKDWVRVMEAEVTVTGECDSTELLHKGQWMEKTYTLKEVRMLDGNIDIPCDIPNRKGENLSYVFTAVIRHPGGKTEKIDMSQNSVQWYKLTIGRWCKMHPETYQFNLDSCRKERP